jgi:hypothetical protein
MIDFLLDVLKTAIAVFAVNKLMFGQYRKQDEYYYDEAVNKAKK